jgi:hypothetical protein
MIARLHYRRISFEKHAGELLPRLAEAIAQSSTYYALYAYVESDCDSWLLP